MHWTDAFEHYLVAVKTKGGNVKNASPGLAILYVTQLTALTQSVSVDDIICLLRRLNVHVLCRN